MKNPVLPSLEPLLSDLRYVKINEKRISELAQEIAKQELKIPEWREDVFPDKDDKDTINFFFLGNTINFASYWIETVAKKTAHPDYAWNFLMFAADKEHVIKYLQKTKKPTALRSLIETQLEDADIKPFADQVLTAQSWYRGNDGQATENIFGEMIDAILKGKNTAEEAMRYAVERINQTF